MASKEHSVSDDLVRDAKTASSEDLTKSRKHERLT